MNSTDRKLRVFLCHASQDKPVVRELYQRLLAEGWIDPWLDEEKLLAGQDWNMEIEKAVESADAVIVCLSNRSVTKEGVVQKEIKRALDKAEEKPEDIIFIIPLRLDDCSVPRRLKVYHYQDYFKNINVGYKRLCASLERRADTVGIDILGIKGEIAQREQEEQIRKETEKKIRREEEKARRMEIEERIRKENRGTNESSPLNDAQEVTTRYSEHPKLTPKVFEFPAEVKRKSPKHILGLVIDIVGAVGFLLLDVILIRLSLQYNEWWIYLLVIIWILTSSLIAFFIGLFVVGELMDDFKKLLFAEEMGGNLVFLAGNRTLGLLNLQTKKLLSLQKGIRGHDKFVVLPNLNLVVFEKGIIFDLQANKILGDLGDSFRNVVAAGKKKNFLVNSIQKFITVLEYPSKKTISTFKMFGSSSGTLIVSNNENLIIGYDNAISSVIIWSIKSKKEVDSFGVDSMGSYDSFLVINKDDSILAIASGYKIVLYSLAEKKKIWKLSPSGRVLSAIFVPDSPYLVASISYSELIVLDTVSGKYVKIETGENVDKLLYLESSKEIIGLKDYDHKYAVWNADDLIKVYQEAKTKNKN